MKELPDVFAVFIDETYDELIPYFEEYEIHFRKLHNLYDAISLYSEIHRSFAVVFVSKYDIMPYFDRCDCLIFSD